MNSMKISVAFLMLAASVAIAGQPAGSQRTPPANYARQNVQAPANVQHEPEDRMEWLNVALGAKVGTLGLGGELTIGLGRYLNLRGGGSWAGFSLTRKIDDVDYEFDFDMLVFPVMLDIHPFDNNFRISGGVIFNSRARAELTAAPDRDIKIGDNKYPSVIIGNLSGSIETGRRAAPYVGIGFGNAVGKDATLSFAFDLGVCFQTYDVFLTADGSAMDLPRFKDDLRKEQEKIQEEVDDFKIYPVLAFGMAYYF